MREKEREEGMKRGRGDRRKEGGGRGHCRDSVDYKLGNVLIETRKKVCVIIKVRIDA